MFKQIEKQSVSMWHKFVLIIVMIAGSDPISEPVINKCYSTHIGEHINIVPISK